ncbi:hypothetical protein JM658_05195 [Joostella atrarenae]|uniref:Secreted protein n=1 Tax=Joostella atrarenae TaxID=679257 RepID=A0ABS9J1B5_9FLAO|nr:hypothetical protein [Joostella atrarenae]MCF8714219.1 hypothetical protein [Joostella atrarenae]
MRFLVTIIIILFGSVAYAQGDLPNAPIPLEGLNATQQQNDDAKKEKPLDIKAVPDLEIPDAPEAPKERSATDIANKEVNLLAPTEVFLDPGERFQKKTNKDFSKGDNQKIGATTTQYFGDFKTNAKAVKILCRDHQYVDGDRVSVIVNDKVVVPNVYLDSNFKSYFLELEAGFNKIEFKALNQGTSGPNTAQFAIIDDQGVQISSNIWNLATGVKASILIIKE